MVRSRILRPHGRRCPRVSVALRRRRQGENASRARADRRLRPPRRPCEGRGRAASPALAPAPLIAPGLQAEVRSLRLLLDLNICGTGCEGPTLPPGAATPSLLYPRLLVQHEPIRDAFISRPHQVRDL